MERKEVMNVVYSSDDNYVQHAVTSIVSLAQNNKNFKTINIYLIENNISIEKRNQVENLIEKYEQLSLEWINFSKWLKRLKLNMQWDISIPVREMRVKHWNIISGQKKRIIHIVSRIV